MDRSTVPTCALSRRNLIGVGAASLFFAPSLAQAVPGSDQVAELTTGENGANLLTIGVLINDKGPFHFVVDTGADRTVIADDVAQQLGLRVSGPVMVEGVVSTIRTDAVEIGSLAVGAITREDLNAPVLPRSQLQADGYLGLDVIDGYRVALDFQSGVLAITQPRPIQLTGSGPLSEIPVHVAGSGGHLRSLNCVVDTVHATAFVDTGAEISVGNSLLDQALTERYQSYMRQEMIPLTGVTGGVVSGHVTKVNNVRLGGMTVEQSRIAIADLQIFRLWQLADRPALLIGMNWLRQFSKLSIDYGRKELRFGLTGRRREEQLRCSAPGAAKGDCRYLLGSPNTTPRPSVPT